MRNLKKLKLIGSNEKTSTAHRSVPDGNTLCRLDGVLHFGR